jgi:hypothetical protein
VGIGATASKAAAPNRAGANQQLQEITSAAANRSISDFATKSANRDKTHRRGE